MTIMTKGHQRQSQRLITTILEWHARQSRDTEATRRHQVMRNSGENSLEECRQWQRLTVINWGKYILLRRLECEWRDMRSWILRIIHLFIHVEAAPLKALIDVFFRRIRLQTEGVSCRRIYETRRTWKMTFCARFMAEGKGWCHLHRECLKSESVLYAKLTKTKTKTKAKAVLLCMVNAIKRRSPAFLWMGKRPC